MIIQSSVLQCCKILWFNSIQILLQMIVPWKFIQQKHLSIKQLLILPSVHPSVRLFTWHFWKTCEIYSACTPLPWQRDLSKVDHQPLFFIPTCCAVAQRDQNTLATWAQRTEVPRGRKNHSSFKSPDCRSCWILIFLLFQMLPIPIF